MPDGVGGMSASRGQALRVRRGRQVSVEPQPVDVSFVGSNEARKGEFITPWRKGRRCVSPGGKVAFLTGNRMDQPDSVGRSRAESQPWFVGMPGQISAKSDVKIFRIRYADLPQRFLLPAVQAMD